MPKIEKVTGAEVVTSLGKNFDPDRALIVVAGDAKEITKSLKAAKLGPIQEVSIKDLL